MSEYDISYIINNTAIVFDVKVIPKSPRPGVDSIRNGALLVRVSAAPEKGKANLELEKTLAEALGIALAQVSVVSGQSSRAKRVRIPLGSERRLRELLAEVGALNITVSAR
jgi:uncharacterized protein (TIGR00251 family)